MNAAHQLSLFRRERRQMPAAIPFKEKTNLSEVLAFIGQASPVQLRAVKIALLQRRQCVSYSVKLKNCAEETWIVDSPDQMLEILLGERRGILQISKGKETIR